MTAVYRVIDANANRLREGLRTIEEYFRFIHENKTVTQSLKSTRHQITKNLNALDEHKLLKARDSSGDIGKKSIKTESFRKSAESIVIINFKRTQEAARVLEEYIKLVDPETAENFKKIRFQLYGFEKKIILLLNNREKKQHGAKEQKNKN